MTNLQAYSIVTALMVVTALLRGVVIHFWGALNFDEIISTSIATLPLADIWSYVKFEMHPPAHFYFLHFWTRLFGSGEVIMRWSSVITSLAIIPASYMLGNIAFRSKKAGVVMAVIGSFLGLIAFHAIIIRMVSLLILFGILSYYFLFRALGSKRAVHWIFYILTTTLALYTHITAAIIPVVHALYVLYLYIKKHITKAHSMQWLRSIVIASLLFAPWFIHFVNLRLSRLQGNAWYIYAPSESIAWLSVPLNLILHFDAPAFLNMLAFLFFGGLISYGIALVSRSEQNTWQVKSIITPPVVLGLITVFLPTIILSVLSLNPLRYYSVAGIGLLFLITAGLTRIVHKKAFALVTSLLIALLLSLPMQMLDARNPDWDKAAKYIAKNEQPGDRIITGFSAEQFAIAHYYTGQTPVEVFVPSAEAELYTPDVLQTAIHTNVNITVNQENIHEFTTLIGDSNSVYFVFNPVLFGRSYEYYVQWFLDNNWQRQTYLETKTSDRVQVWHLTKS